MLLLIAQLFLFFLASISDYWDGFLARKYNLESIIGAILDPIADKILTTFLILALSIEFSSIFIGMIGGIILVREYWVGALRDFNAKNGNDEFLPHLTLCFCGRRGNRFPAFSCLKPCANQCFWGQFAMRDFTPSGKVCTCSLSVET